MDSMDEGFDQLDLGAGLLDEQQNTDFGAGLAVQGAAQQSDLWRAAFLRVATAMGVRQAAEGAEPHVESVLQAVHSLRQSEAQLQEGLAALQQSEAALQVQVAHLTATNLELRRELGSGWALADPNIIQVRQLVLDPAIQREFTRLKDEADGMHNTIKQLREQTESLTFTQESKLGRQLINKTKQLAQENLEFGRLKHEGANATQGALLALERHHAAELRKGLVDVKDHCELLSEENEELNMLRFLTERQMAEVAALGGPPGAAPGGPSPHHGGPSPHHGGPSPHHGGPSPHHGGLSPHHGGPSPHHGGHAHAAAPYGPPRGGGPPPERERLGPPPQLRDRSRDRERERSRERERPGDRDRGGGYVRRSGSGDYAGAGRGRGSGGAYAGHKRPR